MLETCSFAFSNCFLKETRLPFPKNLSPASVPSHFLHSSRHLHFFEGVKPCPHWEFMLFFRNIGTVRRLGTTVNVDFHFSRVIYFCICFLYWIVSYQELRIGSYLQAYLVSQSYNWSCFNMLNINYKLYNALSIIYMHVYAFLFFIASYKVDIIIRTILKLIKHSYSYFKYLLRS